MICAGICLTTFAFQLTTTRCASCSTTATSLMRQKSLFTDRTRIIPRQTKSLPFPLRITPNAAATKMTNGSEEGRGLEDGELFASWTIKQLLEALNERGIRYPVTACRTDLEDLLISAQLKDRQQTNDDREDDAQSETMATASSAVSSNETVQTLNPHDDEEQQEEPWELRARRRRRRQRQHDTPSSWSRVVVSVPSKAARNVLDRAKRQARRVSRNAVDFFVVDDETGVRDAKYQYLHKDEHPSTSVMIDVPAHDVKVVRIDENDASEPSPRRAHRASRTTAMPPSQRRPPRQRPTRAATSSSEPRRPKPPSRVQRPRRRPTDVHDRPSEGRSPVAKQQSSRKGSIPEATTSTRPYLLPPATSRTSGEGPSFSRNRTTRSSRSRPTPPQADRPRKRVYSPYNNNNDNTVFDDRDVIDRVGEFLADTADKFMWGRYDEDRPKDYSRQRDQPKKPSHRRPASNKRKPSQRKHWKDRLEERLDSMLGLHEEGDFYRKWAEREEKEKQEQGGNDVFSVAQGRQPKRRQKPIHDKPFWEEEGNLVSLLFGRTKRGGDLFFDHRLGSGSGSLLFLIRATLRSFLMVASYLCRWASTQGALPQPVVVVSVFTAGICARPRRRLATVAITLLLMRTVGEVLHGYAFGSDGWEDGEEEDGDDDDVSWEGDGM